jgi:hypothetical protein
MAKQRVLQRPGEPPGPGLPINTSRPRPDLESMQQTDGSEESSASRKRPARHMDRYDIIGVVIVCVLVALWVVHFLLPTPPPDNFPNVNPPSERR